MITTLHKKIKLFQIDGYLADDSRILDIKELNERVLDVQMRDKGYVRILDLDPHWSIDYNAVDCNWGFKMSMFGTYVGKRKSWQYEGTWQGKLMPRSTRKVTSDPS